MKELHRSRLQHVVTDSAKALVRQVLPKLETCKLRDKIKLCMEFWKVDYKKNFHYFMDRVKTTYTEVAAYLEDLSPSSNKEYLGSDRRPKRDCKSKDRAYKLITPEDKRREKPLGSRSNN